MPYIGDIALHTEIGKTTKGKYIWHKCTKCGNERWVKIVNGFPRNVNCRKCRCLGYKHTTEQRLKRSQQLKQYYKDNPNKVRKGNDHPMFGKKHKPETLIIMAESKKGKYVGKSNPFYGKHHTPETIEKLRKSSTGVKHSEETRRKMRVAQKGKKMSPESIEKTRLANIGKIVSEETKERLRISHLGYKPTKQQTEKIRVANTGKIRTTDTKLKIAKAVKNTWDNYDEPTRRSRMRNFFKSINNNPNASELYLLNIINQLEPNKWMYVGDGDFWIGRKNPDFWNGDSKVIELYGEYWHTKTESVNRISYFAKHGYNTLIIWWLELSNKESLISNLNDFIKG